MWRTPIGVFKGGQIWLKVKVKLFNSQKGFGFIQPTDGGPDVFVHISAVERAVKSNLNEGQKLTYDVVSERGRLAA
jgi:cold shock protein